MFIRIYDYLDNEVLVEVPENKEIQSIVVTMISGDETGTINFTDGTMLDFDASKDRIIDYTDVTYVVTGENIPVWLEAKTNHHNPWRCRGAFGAYE